MLIRLLAANFLVLAMIFASTCVIYGKTSQASADTTITKSGNNRITVIQEGNGNSATISQRGSNTKTTAAVKSNGNNNHTEIFTGSDILTTNIILHGKSNKVVSRAGPRIRLFFIKSTPFPITDKNINMFDYTFISKQTTHTIRVHQTTDGVSINNKEQ